MTSDVIHEELEEMKIEWRELKSRALNLLLAALFVLVGYGVWVGTISTNVKNNQARIDANTANIASIANKQQSNDISNAEVRAKLANIEASLIEIKEALKIRNSGK